MLFSSQHRTLLPLRNFAQPCHQPFSHSHILEVCNLFHTFTIWSSRWQKESIQRSVDRCPQFEVVDSSYCLPAIVLELSSFCSLSIIAAVDPVAVLAVFDQVWAFSNKCIIAFSFLFFLSHFSFFFISHFSFSIFFLISNKCITAFFFSNQSSRPRMSLPKMIQFWAITNSRWMPIAGCTIYFLEKLF